MVVKTQVEFNVTVKKNEGVAPEIPIQEHRLPQSNFDLLLPRLYLSLILCYKKPLEETYTFEHMVAVLKKALARTLVSFYPLAGEIVQNDAGEPELLCNNHGVDFIEAFADVELKDLNFHNPDECFGGKLVPVMKRGKLAAIQVTELKCGGLVVVCTFDHRLADAYSTNMFILSWVELAKGKPLPQIPSFGRSALPSPRHPGHYDSIVNQLYLPISALPPPPNDPKHEANDNDQEAISRIYYIRADEIGFLQSLANNGINNPENKRTKLEAFGALLWKTLASSIDKSNDKICRLGIVVDGRSRLAGGDEKQAKLMAAYYGNVLSIPFGEKKCEELKEKPLSWVADQVRDFLKGAVTKEHFLGVIDWVEAHRPEPAFTKIYVTRVREEGPAIVVSSGQRFPVAKMDFGWGVSAFSSYYFPWDGQTGYVMPMPSPRGNGDWIVYMHLLEEQLDYIESSDVGPLFNPLSSGYLNLV